MTPLAWIGLMALVLAGSGAAFTAFTRRVESRRRRLPDGVLTPSLLRDALLHALATDSGYLRDDVRIRGPLGGALLVERGGPVGTLALLPATDGLQSVDADDADADIERTCATLSAGSGGNSRSLVLIGGAAEFGRAALGRVRGLRGIHVSDAGAVTETTWFGDSVPALVVRAAVERVARNLSRGQPRFLDVGAALELSRARSLAGDDLDAEVQIPYRGPVTVGLTLTVFACFLAQGFFHADSWRGSELAVPVAYRMGALWRDAVLAGEVQRLVAAAFLHFGFTHLAMNAWAQWSLGTPLEFLLGPSRFLLLWLSSALGASLVSLATNDDVVSAGASGAIFGLLGAFTVFVFVRRDVLPQPVPRQLRVGVLVTLLLNGLISFVPNIDVSAHVGGAATGAALALVPGLLRRIPPSPTSSASRLLGAVPALVAAFAVGLTAIEHRPWAVLELPETRLAPRAAGEVRYSWPEGFPVSERTDDGWTVVSGDGAPSSPFELELRVSEPYANAAARDRARSRRRSALEAGSGDASRARMLVVTWSAVTTGGRLVEVAVTTPAARKEEASRWGRLVMDSVDDARP